MDNRKNPFRELYITESISSDRFVQLFSPFLVDKALALFEPGHVILKGLPGTGKSMLLSLLKPTVRIAYAKCNVEFPVPRTFSNFIGAGINLRRSGVSDFGNRPVSSEVGFEDSAFYFADYLNYWITLDILESTELLGDKSLDIQYEMNIDISPENLDQFAVSFSKDSCWNDYLADVTSYNGLKDRLTKRIKIYRDFLNYNTDFIPEDVKSSKTLIGLPMAALADSLRAHGIIASKTEIFVKIDQYEELAWLEDLPNHQDKSYQEMVHKLLAMRDTTVSYRLGTRHFAWNDRGNIFGTTAKLEKGRNYIELSIDAVLKRKENRRTWIFPEFAEDILRRRIGSNSINRINSKDRSILLEAFGRTPRPSAKANRYVKSDKKKAIKIEKNWPSEWALFLNNLVQEDPFNARLAEAWVRQKGKSKQSVMYKIPEANDDYPWNKQWWKKERTDQALFQIASRNNQKPIWYGKEDILSLSGSNILAFLQICRSIWDVWIRDTQDTGNLHMTLPIDVEIQTVGIFEASNSWLDNISQEKGGKERKLFVNFLGSFFYKKLINDISMSYPGHNGFSLDVEQLEKDEFVKKFLNEATDFGDLYDASHTSKLDNKRERIKWYLNPLFSPHFAIPSAHTKEPIYVNVSDVRKWIMEAIDEDSSSQIKRRPTSSGNSSGQMSINF